MRFLRYEMVDLEYMAVYLLLYLQQLYIVKLKKYAITKAPQKYVYVEEKK